MDASMSGHPVFTEADVVRAQRAVAGIQTWLPRLRKSSQALGAQPGSHIADQVEWLETAAWLGALVPELAKPVDDAEAETRQLRVILAEAMSVLGQAATVADYLERYGAHGHVSRPGARAVAADFLGNLQELFIRIGIDPAAPAADSEDA